MTNAINRILVPVDFSAHSDKAVTYATTLADRLGANVELLHVVEDPFVSGAWSAEAFVPNIPELLNDLIAAARSRLANLATVVRDKGLNATATVLTGHPANMIVEYARTGRFDLIVMGTHGRTGLAHALLGSIAERVVRTAPCPVLSVRTIGPAEEGESTGAAKAVA